jgi:hypothetical protein
VGDSSNLSPTSRSREEKGAGKENETEPKDKFLIKTYPQVNTLCYPVLSVMQSRSRKEAHHFGGVGFVSRFGPGSEFDIMMQLRNTVFHLSKIFKIVLYCKYHMYMQDNQALLRSLLL